MTKPFFAMHYNYFDDPTQSPDFIYANLDWQAEWIGEDQTRYLGHHNEWEDRSSDTNEDYDEKSLKLDSPGFQHWIDDQLDRAVASKLPWIEWDNADNTLDRSREALGDVYSKTIGRGLKVILKNPKERDIQDFGAMKDMSGNIAIAGCVFELGTMSPHEFGFARRLRNPALQATWVFHGGRGGVGHHSEAVSEVSKEIPDVSGTSVQWGPSEYHGMKILVFSDLKKIS